MTSSVAKILQSPVFLLQRFYIPRSKIDTKIQDCSLSGSSCGWPEQQTIKTGWSAKTPVVDLQQARALWFHFLVKIDSMTACG